ncbi:MAG TPA: hypothetical protein VFY65_17240 [Longimicrobium sp.]|nr:hypothetical protein [Longimicrobium sp.]
MRLTHLAVFASLAALAACSDAPVTQAEPTDLYDMSNVTLITPDQYAAHGISATPTGTASTPDVQPMFIDQPCYLEPCDPEPYDPPEADADWWGGVFNESSCCSKAVRLHAKSDAHNNMDQTTLTVSFRLVGGQGTSGCYATPAQYATETQTKYGAPVNITIERYYTYPHSETKVWEVRSTHKFIANSGYVLPTGVRTASYPSGGTLCV